MKRKENHYSNLWTIDNQGNMKFSTREGRLESMMDRDTVFGKLAIGLMFICGAIDFFAFKQQFGIMLYDHPLYQAGMIIGFLVMFDVGAVLLGYFLKRRSQGLKSSKIAEWSLIAVIVTGVVFNLWLRIVKRDELIPLDTMQGSLFGAVTEGPTSDPAALPYAIVSSLLPLGTTIVSIIASYVGSNPLGNALKKVRKQKVEIENKINEINAAIAELNADKEMARRMDEQDARLLAEKVIYARTLGLTYSDYVRQRIKEHIGDPASTNELSKNVHQCILEQHFPQAVNEALEQSEQSELPAV